VRRFHGKQALPSVGRWGSWLTLGNTPLVETKLLRSVSLGEADLRWRTRGADDYIRDHYIRDHYIRDHYIRDHCVYALELPKLRFHWGVGLGPNQP
jgi:hypothetical protein